MENSWGIRDNVQEFYVDPKSVLYIVYDIFNTKKKWYVLKFAQVLYSSVEDPEKPKGMMLCATHFSNRTDPQGGRREDEDRVKSLW